jgi:DNA polymerase III subunit delta'
MTDSESLLAEAMRDHEHAYQVLSTSLADSAPSHAYLFYGPPGVGKRSAARAFAAHLLALDEPEPANTKQRALSGYHPDLTWVIPTGAHVMRVEDIEEPVIASAGRTPFEASRRVFVLEACETMTDEVANRLLKTLEEPPAFVHLILVTDAISSVLETVLSRCQLVRFDSLSQASITETLKSEGADPALAVACGRLALGNARRARFLASEEGQTLRADVAAFIKSLLCGQSSEEAQRNILKRADDRRAGAESEISSQATQRLELEPKDRHRRFLERTFEESGKRQGRRAHTEVLELSLVLMALLLRDLACVGIGASDVVFATDQIESIAQAAKGNLDPHNLYSAATTCEQTRQSLQLNVTEDLALEALSIRLAGLVGPNGDATPAGSA